MSKPDSSNKVNLRIPGPVPLPDEILDVLASQMTNHRGPDFKDMLDRLTVNLRTILKTQNDVFFLTCSGTGAMDAAVANTVNRGDVVAVISSGWFGDRFADIVRAYGADLRKIDFEPGTGVEPSKVEAELKKIKNVKAVFITHNESSSGVCNPLQELSRTVRKIHPGTLLVVDAISSVGGIPIEVDAWDIDVLVCASQKALLGPPGIGMLSFSKRAWDAHAVANSPRYYLNLTLYRDSLKQKQTPFTPAIPVLNCLEYSFDVLLSNGMQASFDKHRRAARKVRAGVRSLGLEVLPPEKFMSDTVTAVKLPSDLDGGRLIQRIADNHGVILGGGLGALAGKIFRIGHMGWANDLADLDDSLEAIARELDALRAAKQ